MERLTLLRSLFLLSLLPSASFAADELGIIRRPYTNHVQEILTGCQDEVSPLSPSLAHLRQYRATRAARKQDTIVMFFRPSLCAAETYGDPLAFREKVRAEKIRFSTGSNLANAANTCIEALGAAAALQDRICGGVSSEVHLQVLATEDPSHFSGEFEACAGKSNCLFVERGKPNGNIEQFKLSDYAQRIVGTRELRPARIITAEPVGGGRPADPIRPAPPERRAGGQERAPASPDRGAFRGFIGTIMLPILPGH